MYLPDPGIEPRSPALAKGKYNTGKKRSSLECSLRLFFRNTANYFTTVLCFMFLTMKFSAFQ